MKTNDLWVQDFLLPHLRANIHLFVPHAEATPESLRRQLAVVRDSPIWAAVNANPIAPRVVAAVLGAPMPVPPLDLTEAEFFPCELPLTRRELDPEEGGNWCRVALGLDDQVDQDRELLRTLRRNLPIEGIRVPGAAIRLPAYLSRLQSAWEGQIAGKRYLHQLFYEDYLADLGEEMARLVDRTVMEQRLPGIQAQADSDIRLRRFPEGELHAPMVEVGLAPEDADRLLLLLKREYPGRTFVAGVAGLHLLLLRYPAAGPKSACWARLQILPDRRPGKVYVEPVMWTRLHGGDTDGDLAYLLLSGKTFGRPRPVGAFPRLTLNPSKG